MNLAILSCTSSQPSAAIITTATNPATLAIGTQTSDKSHTVTLVADVKTWTAN